MADDDAEFFAKLDAMGEAEVRARLKGREWGVRERQVHHWLEGREAAKAASGEERDERAVRAAEDSAAQATRAADAAERSAKAAESADRTAKRSLWIALFALIVAIAAAYIEYKKK
jgi:hypothetical protein